MLKKILLAYHATQKNLAASLQQKLAGTNVNFEHVVSAPDDLDFYEKLKQRRAPTLLLLSDNLLKSAETMLNALRHLQELYKRDDFKIIVVPGEDVSGEKVPTNFERISHIIHYMNYWQDEYLASRQAGRKAGGLTEDMDQLIKTNREISTQVGEVLRYLRDQSNWNLANLEAENFESLLSFYQLTGPVSAANISPEIPVATEPIIIEPTPEIETPEIQEEEIEVELPQIEEALNPFVLEEIPQEKLADVNVLQMDASREIIEEIPEFEGEEIAFQSSLDLVNDFISRQEYDSAKVLLEQMLDSHPTEATVWSRLGLLSEEEGDFINAGEYYSKALELDPTVPELDFKMGMITSSYQPDNVEAALNHFDRAIKKNPQHTEAYYQFGVLLNERADRISEAIAVFRKVLKLNPQHEFANYDLALIYFDQGDKQKARSYYVDAFKNNPELRTKVNDQAFDLQGVNTSYSTIIEDPEKTAISEAVEEDISPIVETPIVESAPSATEEIVEEPNIKTTEVPDTPVQQAIKLKTVLITGGTAGIGKATALAFINAGYRVIITGRRAERLSDFTTSLHKKQRANVRTLAFDVRDINAVQNALNALPAEFQEIDILINNAGLASGFDPIYQGKIEDWNKMIDTNIKGLLFISRLVTPGMVKRKSGHVINLCSTAGHEVYPKGNVYCATKHAVDALTQGMRLDLYKHGIRVSQISPAHVEETEFAKVRFHGDEEKAKIYNDFNPLKSNDVAEAILFIASRPAHVNIHDIVLMGTQQANSNHVDRTGRKYD